MEYQKKWLPLFVSGIIDSSTVIVNSITYLWILFLMGCLTADKMTSIFLRICETHHEKLDSSAIPLALENYATSTG